MHERVYNFSAGPGTLPLSVLQEAQQHLLSLPGAGMSVLELNHRSTWFADIIEAAEANLRRLLNVPAHFHVLFLHGGARLQYSMIPINFLSGTGKVADYLVTGAWSQRAIKEARREGPVHVAWDGQSEQYARVPKQEELTLDPNAAYVHYISNETIQGIQFRTEPDPGEIPLICDATSDLLSRPISLEPYALVYAAAQKNAGPAGVTIVIIREDMLERIPENLPGMLDYRLHAQNRSFTNTPPVFAIYMVMLVTRWLLEEIGGLQTMATINEQKAGLLYEVIDQSQGFYRGHAQPGSRSTMNVTWRLANEELEHEFIQQAQTHGLHELRRHQTVKVVRASLYNAMPLEGVKALRDFMIEFQAARG